MEDTSTARLARRVKENNERIEKNEEKIEENNERIEENVNGAISAADENIAVFDGTDGKKIKDGGKKICDLLPLSGGNVDGDFFVIGDGHKIERTVTHTTNQDEEIRIGSYYKGNFYGIGLNYQIDSVGEVSKYIISYYAGVRSKPIEILRNGKLLLHDTLYSAANSGGHKAMFENSGVLNEYIFGGERVDGTRDYIRVGRGKLQYSENGTTRTMWHSGNDGSGSGLDADKVDGTHLSNLAVSAHAGEANLDNITTSGMWRLGAVTSGFPNASWSQMIVVQGGGDTIAQIGLPYAANELYLRQGTLTTFKTNAWSRTWNSINAPSVSARKYKDNIQNYETDIDRLLQLQPVKFDWKEFEAYNGKTHVGIIADDAESIYPELVFYKENEQEDGTIIKEVEGFNYQDLTVMLLDVCKKQKEQLDKQQQQINDLEQRLRMIEDMLQVQ